MTDLERQLATLLKDASGEPPIMLDLNALSFATVTRHRYLTPLIAAAAVVAIAIPVSVLIDRGSSPTTPSSSPTTGPIHDQSTGPRRAAIGTAERIIATAPVPPSATRLVPPPPAALKHPDSIPGAQHVQRTRFWTAPGTVATTITYLKSHPPTGMHWSGSGSTGGPNIAPNESLDFAADQFRSLNYTVLAYHGRIAIRADAQVLCAPSRATADMIPASVNSVDVLIVRKGPQRHQGAPAMRRTLTGTAATALADFVNQLPRAIPGGSISCPTNPVGERRIDRLVFHSTGQAATLVVDMVGCARATFQSEHRTPIQLSRTFAGVVAEINSRIMTAVGLPANYGR